jgi:hypothetical protein
LTCKLAESIDDVDLSGHAPGDVIRLPDRDARMLIAEGWATLVDSRVSARDRRETPTGRRGPSPRR